jgi:hypothetical protein
MGFRLACKYGYLALVDRLLGLEGDRRIDVHAFDDNAFREAWDWQYQPLFDRLLSLAGDRAIPAHVVSENNVKDGAPRLLISEWADARERRRAGHKQRPGNDLAKLWRHLPRGALAEVLSQGRRPA